MPLVHLSRPREGIWQLTLNAPPDNRLTPDLLSTLAGHLDTIEAEWRESGGGETSAKKRGARGAGAVVLTSGVERFFSNGLDYDNAMKVDKFFERVYDPVMWRLLTFPLVTVAAITGHAFAGGMVLALCCDYRVMTSGKGLLCMNEASLLNKRAVRKWMWSLTRQISFSSPLPNSFAAFLKLRIPHPPHLRDTLLGRRWTQSQALAAGIIDEIVEAGGADAVVSCAVEIGQREGVKVAPGPWGMIKAGVYHDVLDASKSERPVLFPPQEAAAFFKRIRGGETKAKL